MMADWVSLWHCWDALKSPELGLRRHHIRFPTERTSTVTHRQPWSWSKGTAKNPHWTQEPRREQIAYRQHLEHKICRRQEGKRELLEVPIGTRSPLPTANGKLWCDLKHSLLFWGKSIPAASSGTGIFNINIYIFITPLSKLYWRHKKVISNCFRPKLCSSYHKKMASAVTAFVTSCHPLTRVLAKKNDRQLLSDNGSGILAASQLKGTLKPLC